VPPAMPAIAPVLSDPALLGLIAAGLIAAGSQTVLQALLQMTIANDMDDRAGAYLLDEFGSLVALVFGGALADGASLRNRGYGLWIGATLALSGLVVLIVPGWGLLSPGMVLMVSGWLVSASLGAFYARIFEM